jgi:hypothetical protein
LHIRGENGGFLRHFSSNNELAIMRTFTCDTVPFSVADARGATFA